MRVKLYLGAVVAAPHREMADATIRSWLASADESRSCNDMVNVERI